MVGSYGLTTLLCFFPLLSLSLSHLPSSCLSDLVSPSAGRCCTPHTFIVVEFTLGFGCDAPEFLDEGVRLEVERGAQDWEPIRFYSPNINISKPDIIVHFDDDARETVHAQAFEENSTFPFHFVNASEGPVRIREYLCGEEYMNETVRFRWMQRYAPPSIENVSTWWLDDVKVSFWDGTRLLTVIESDFSDDNMASYSKFLVRSGVVERPSCSSSDSTALYFRFESPQRFPRRSLVISRFSILCPAGTCPPPVPRIQDSECSVTTCGADSIKCSVGTFRDCSTCPSGFSTTTTGENTRHTSVACLDEDECSLNTHNCSGVAECVNTDGSFVCSCPSGYTLTSEGNSCLDIDECSDPSLNNCSHSCANIAGGFLCSCPPGYVLSDDSFCTVARVEFDSSVYTVAEGGNVSLNVVVLDDITEDLTVTLRTKDISAVSDSDYSAVSLSVTFSPDYRSHPLIIQALEDDEAELVESFSVTISQPLQDLGTVVVDNATVYIFDTNDVLLEFYPVSYTVMEGDDVMFRIVKQTNSSRKATVVFSTIPGTADADSDYDPVYNLTITFDPEETEHTVKVSTIGDGVLERDEEFTAVLELVEGGGGGVTLGQSIATATILDDDDVAVGFSSTDSYEVIEGERVEVSVRMEGETDIDVVVSVTSHDSTADAFEDYTTINQTLTFSKFISTHNISVYTKDDDDLEEDEMFQLVLSQPQPANERVKLVDTTVINVTIMDNDAPRADLPPVTLGFERSMYNVSEDAQPFPICVEVKEGQLEDHISVTINIMDLEAEAGKDYIWLPISENPDFELSFSPGQSLVCLGDISPVNDAEIEDVNPERFQLSLVTLPTTRHGQRVFVEPLTAQVAVYDDDYVLEEIGSISNDPSAAIGQLSGLVDAIVESGRTVSPQVSMQIMEASQELLQNLGAGDGGDGSGSVVVLDTLDRFALSAYDEKAQPELKIKGMSLRVQEVTSDPSTSTVIGIEQNGTTIELPVEAFARANQTVRVASFIFTNLSNALTNQIEDSNEESIIVSPVISTALGCGRGGKECPSEATNGFSMPVRILLPITKVDESKNIVHCNFLNTANNVWSGAGCTPVETTNTTVICECNHLTHFAILLSPNLNLTDAEAVPLQIIGYVGVSISVVCMAITIVALLALKSLWGMRNYIHVNLCACLIVAQLIFVIGVDKTQNQGACSAIAVLLHYWFLAAFMWMLMEGVVLYVALVRVFVKKQRFYIAGFTIVSYGVPLLYMVITVPLGLVLGDEHGNHYGSSQACWLRADTHFIWAFIVPVILIILANIGFFIMAVYIMYKHQRRSVHKGAVKKVKHWLKTSVALLFVMGITWIIGVLVFHEALLFVAYIFTIFMAFQGAVIFVMFILLSKQVRENYKKWWRGKVAESDVLSKYFSSSESSGKRGLGRFISLRTSSFRLSRHRSTFRSSNIDSEMKLPDEPSESPRNTLSPENRMNEYMKKHKYMLGESVTESGDHFTEDPNISSYSVKKVTFDDSLTETYDGLPVCPANGHASGVASFVSNGDVKTENNHNCVSVNSHDPASIHKEDIPSVNGISDSSAKPKDKTTLVSEDDDPSQDQKNSLAMEPQRHNTDSSDTQKPEVRQDREDQASL